MLTVRRLQELRQKALVAVLQLHRPQYGIPTLLIAPFLGMYISLLFNVAFVAVLLVLFCEDLNILVNRVHLQERTVRVGQEKETECVHRVVFGILFRDDMYIVVRSPQGPERMLATLADVLGA